MTLDLAGMRSRSLARVYVLFALVLVVTCASSFLFGIVTYRAKVFPYELLRSIWSSEELDFAKPLPRFSIDEAEIAKRFNHLRNHGTQVRADLLRRLVVDEYDYQELSRDDARALKIPQDLFVHGRVYMVRTYGIVHLGVLAKAERESAHGLLIYIHGHSGSPIGDEDFHEIRATALEAGFDVLTLSMSAIGFNAIDRSFPTVFGELEMPREQTEHLQFALFRDPDRPYLDPLTSMISGNYHLIQETIAHGGYGTAYMAGVSGGGWYSTILSALNPQIDESVAFAGTVPLELRGEPGNLSDWEAVAAPIYQRYNYWDFYNLATLDENIEMPRRRHLQVYNSEDPCCYDGRSAKVVRSVAARLDMPGFGVEILEESDHRANPEFIRHLWFDR